MPAEPSSLRGPRLSERPSGAVRRGWPPTSRQAWRRALSILAMVLLVVAGEIYVSVLVGRRLSLMLVVALTCVIISVVVFGYLFISDREELPRP
ncbi:hypothetical protein LXT21_23685 [Myxococcus sp. K38C18041901]|uniref:hypothetical protein n=1 Tax=Myxococcus guangdongensis TaxID=2906760 RepID=UPI0020A713F6|nr:hypothetical protein [Myxococcus guangdongensis]MCP3061789.1 hypothetical protein [Myxococcus guangdongensis]